MSNRTPLDNLPAAETVPVLVELLGENAHILDSLTLKQRRFVEEYPVDFNATAACVRAGYSPASAKDSGYENLRKQPIVDAITAVMAARSQATTVNRSWVMAQLVDVHNTAKPKEAASHQAIRLRALELIGKHVDVRAFRAGLGFSNDDIDDDGRQLWDLSKLDNDEFDTFERLLAKVTIIGPSSRGEGREGPAGGHGANSERPGGDSPPL